MSKKKRKSNARRMREVRPVNKVRKKRRPTRWEMMNQPWLYSIPSSPERRQRWLKSALRRCNICSCLSVTTITLRFVILIMGLGALEIGLAKKQMVPWSTSITVIIPLAYAIFIIKVHRTMPEKFILNRHSGSGGGYVSKGLRRRTRIKQRIMHTWSILWRRFVALTYLHQIQICVILTLLMIKLCGFTFYEALLLFFMDKPVMQPLVRFTIFLILGIAITEPLLLATQTALELESRVINHAEKIEQSRSED